MKGQELHDRTKEVFDVLGLCLLSASAIGLLLLCEAFGGSLGFEVSTNLFNGLGGCPNASGEILPAFLRGHHPMVARCLNSSRECGVTGRK